ncbi:hypothetical protein SEA_XKCD426_32 [Streptomyces phage Xkcd426]|nr:hypothetical protein SEA_XKCD426_32 [Streptomyces phage Xkcd426]
MARCGCADPEAITGTCACALQAGTSNTVLVTGTGQAADPWKVDVNPNVANSSLQVTAGSGLTLSGAGTAASPWLLGTDNIFSRGLLGTVVHSSTTPLSFNIGSYANAKFVHVRAVGGGGGGAGATAGAGVGIARPGGTGGNYAESWIPVASVPASVTVTSGAGGTGGVAANGAGGNGEDSSFGTLLVATGGRGAGASTTPVAGAVITPGTVPPPLGTGDITFFGGSGEPGIQLAAGTGTGGLGGDSAFGSGDLGGVNSQAGSGGNQYGGGGGGACSFNNAVTGGGGARGVVIIEVWG